MPAKIIGGTPEEQRKRALRLATVKRWQANNPERHKAIMAAQRADPALKEKARIYMREKRSDPYQREKDRAYTREYHRTHVEQEVAYRARTKEQFQRYANGWTRERYKTNPSFRMRKLLQNRLNLVIKGKKKFLNWMANTVGCTAEQLRNHIESQFTEGMSWNNWGKEVEIDHIRPCSAFNLAEVDQQKACFHYTNLRPLWAVENRKKGNKIEWHTTRA